MKRTTYQCSRLRDLLRRIHTFTVLASEITLQIGERIAKSSHSKPRDVQLSAIPDAPQMLQANTLRVFHVGKNLLRQRRVVPTRCHTGDALLLC